MTISEKVFEILTELSGEDDITLESKLQNDLALDSLHMVMLLVELEDRLKISLDESDMNPLELISVDDVVHLAERYCGDNNEKNS